MSFHLHNIRIPFIPKSNSDIWQKDYRFETGQYFHIKASSGKGKSTFIHTLYGLHHNYEGYLKYNEHETGKFSHEQWCNFRSQKVSIVFQDLKLFEENTAVQNIEIKRALTHHYPEAVIRDFAARLGIAHTLEREIRTLSYGERQRVAIIRCLMQPFETLLLDEPFSHLDVNNIELASALIAEEVKKRNATLILCDLEADQHFTYHQQLFL